MSNVKNDAAGTDRSDGHAGTEDVSMPAEERTADGDDKYITELDYISTWDAICYEPSDVYVQGAAMFEGGAFDVGENYPRGV